MTIPTYRHHWPLLVLLLPASFLSVGCGPSDEIQSYTVPKEAAAPAVAAAKTAEAGEPTDRMLGAILPAGDRAWFFKVAGPIAAVDTEADSIADFFSSIRLKPGAAKPEWKLPDGWREEAGTGMRAATIMVPADGKPLELTVIALPSSGAPDEILSNINRWRGQMNLPVVDQRGLAEFTRETKAGDATMTIVDLRGQFSAGSMVAPFAGRGAGAASGVAQNQADNLPAGHPPIDATSGIQRDESPASAPADVPKFDAPASWQQLPGGGFRKAAFEVRDGERKALVTVIDFRLDSGQMIADPLQNINQWRGAIGLEPLEKDSLESAVELIEVDGQPTTYAKIQADPAKPEESKIDQATLAAMIKSGDRIWFFKMLGDRDLVAAQEDEFKTFLMSVRFAADAGAPDGNE